MDAAISFAQLADRLKYEDIPQATVDVAKKDILDTLGTILAGSTAEGAEAMAGLAEELGGKPESSVLAYGLRVPSPEAAMVNTPWARLKRSMAPRKANGLRAVFTNLTAPPDWQVSRISIRFKAGTAAIRSPNSSAGSSRRCTCPVASGISTVPSPTAAGSRPSSRPWPNARAGTGGSNWSTVPTRR